MSEEKKKRRMCIECRNTFAGSGSDYCYRCLELVNARASPEKCQKKVQDLTPKNRVYRIELVGQSIWGTWGQMHAIAKALLDHGIWYFTVDEKKD